MALNDRQRKFAEAYAGSGNATEAAKSAGYSRRTARAQGARLLTNADIKRYLQELQGETRAERIASMSEVKAFWTDTMNDATARTADRLKASELLARSAGAFAFAVSGDDRGAAVVGVSSGDGSDVIIYLPAMESETACQWHDDDEEEGFHDESDKV